MKHRNKIAVKLTLYFSAALLLFSVIIAITFGIITTVNVKSMQRKDLEERARQIAERMQGFYSNENSRGHGQGQGGLGAYLRVLNDVAAADAWVIEKDSKEIHCSFMDIQVNYDDLPENATDVIDKAMAGETFISENFSGVLQEPYFTVGVPIWVDDESTAGAVLLHSPVQQVSQAIWNSLKVLAVGIVVALVISVILAILLSKRFTRPLHTIHQTAVELANGNYSARSEISLKDEIGDLSNTVNLLSERLYQASQESLALEQMKQEFISNVSHELRTPVMVLRGSLEALRDGIVTDPERQKVYFDQMLSESIQLQRLVNDLLELTRLQSAKFMMDKQKVNLCEILSDAVRGMQQLANTKDIIIIKNIETPVFCIYGDYNRIRQMIVIILDNAIKFSPNHKNVRVHFNVDTAGKGHLSIQDEGFGISATDVPHLFDRFQRSRTEENQNGTGLGLAIVKQISQRHDIDISVQSAFGKGSDFQFIFMVYIEND